MITYFYKILYNNKDVVYIGVTTRKINHRFREHIISKNLNKKYSIIEFDKVIHPKINSLKIYHEERLKIVELERKYIQEEKDKGSILFNISKGGEWGSNILNTLLKKDFFKKYGNYDGYKEYINLYNNKKKKIKNWIRHWCRTIADKDTEHWIRHWISNKTRNKTKQWIRSWSDNLSINKSKKWLQTWTKHKSYNKTKRWIYFWIKNITENKTKRWIRNWVTHKSYNKTKQWIRNWLYCKDINKTKQWLKNWVLHKKY